MDNAVSSLVRGSGFGSIRRPICVVTNEELMIATHTLGCIRP